MIEEVEHLIEKYVSWLKDRTALRELGDWVEITTPYLDRHNDYIQIYARRENGAMVLTDDGYTLGDLSASGCALESPKRQKLLQVALNGFGVKLRDSALEVRTSAQDFPRRKHDLVQAMLAVNDLFYLAAPNVASLFFEDVLAWLDLTEVRYTQKVKFTGKTGFDHLFDFVIPKSRVSPERIVQTINRPNRDSAMKLVMSWVDTRDARPADADLYAVLNDAEQPPSHEVLDALRNYDVFPVLWSGRGEVQTELAS